MTAFPRCIARFACIIKSVLTNFTAKGVSALNFLFTAVADEVGFPSVRKVLEVEASDA
jgi:hypothetical protein